MGLGIGGTKDGSEPTVCGVDRSVENNVLIVAGGMSTRTPCGRPHRPAATLGR